MKRWTVLLAGGVAIAQSLTMEQAVSRALEVHPDLTAARASRAVAAFQIQAAQALPAMEVRGIANNFSLDPDASNLRNSVAFKWVPPRPREISLKTRVAEARRRVVDTEIRMAEARVAVAVRQAYRRAALAEERAQLAERALALRKSVLEVTRRQVGLGLKEAVEADLAELSQADAEAVLTRTQAMAAAERRRLARLLDPAGAFTFSLPLETARISRAERAPLVEQALRTRPDAAQVAASCEQAEAASSLANNGLYPWLSTSQVTRRLGTQGGRTGAWGFQVGVELALFRSPAQAASRMAAAAVTKCRLEEQAVRVRVRQEVEEAAAQWEAAIVELEKLEQLSAGPAARALEHMRAALTAGKADRVEVLLAEARQLALRDRWLERRLDITALEAQLELAAGL